MAVLSAEVMAKTLQRAILDLLFENHITGSVYTKGKLVFAEIEVGEEKHVKIFKVSVEEKGVSKTSIDFSVTTKEVTACKSCLCYDCAVICADCENCTAEEKTNTVTHCDTYKSDLQKGADND